MRFLLRYQLILLSLCLGLSVCCLKASAQTQESKSQFQAGLTAYNNKDYTAAVVAFNAAAKADTTNVTAVYYEASSRMMLGRKDEGTQLFQYIVFTFPGTKEAASAAAYLKKLGVSAPVAGPSAAPQAKVASVSKVTPSKVGGEKGNIIDNIVVVVRPQLTHPFVSASFIDQMKDALAAYPKNLLQFLYEKGCRVHLTSTSVDENPSLANTQPTGYEAGATFKNVPAFFDGHNCVVCELAIRGGDGDFAPTIDPTGSLRHEFGHAIDWYLGWISQKEDFKHAYLMDVSKIDYDDKPALQYYLQPGQTGPSEAFAEICCHKFGGRAKGDSRGVRILESFPGAGAVIDKAIKAVH